MFPDIGLIVFVAYLALIGGTVVFVVAVVAGYLWHQYRKDRL